MFLSELLEADEVFICGTNKGIVPVVKVDEAIIGSGKPGPKTRLLIQHFPDFVRTYDAPLIALNESKRPWIAIHENDRRHSGLDPESCLPKN